MTADQQPAAGFDRGDLIRLGGLILVLLAIVGAVLLAGGGGGSERSTGQARGVLTEVSQTRLVLQPDAGAVQEYTVRPEDVRNLDISHLEQHAADQLPSIVHYEQVGDERYATRVDDA
jgi:hypothetical protein